MTDFLRYRLSLLLKIETLVYLDPSLESRWRILTMELVFVNYETQN